MGLLDRIGQRRTEPEVRSQVEVAGDEPLYATKALRKLLSAARAMTLAYVAR